MNESEFKVERTIAALMQRREYLQRELARTRPGSDRKGHEPHAIEGAERVRLADELVHVLDMLDRISE